jgi:hypothetical protein
VAHAWQSESGEKNCGSTIGYAHVRYKNYGNGRGPNGTTQFWPDNDGAWHTREANGSYSGHWSGFGDPELDLANTWAGCRSYG